MKKRILFLFLFCQCCYSFAQTDSAFTIHEVNISDFRLQQIQNSARIKTIDLSPITRNQSGTLTELLSNNSTLFIKDNGGGRLATLSIRGTTASQNTLTWNGLSLNTPTLGLSDLSLVPVFFVDNVAIQYGGNGALNGNAAIGGAVHLSSAPVFGEGWNAKLFTSAASFADYQQGISISFSGKSYYMKTAFFHRNAENNYPFEDIYLLKKPVREQNHARFQQDGFLQEHSFLLKQNIISIQAMLLDASREIPPLMGSADYQSDQFERDRQLRIVTSWKHYARRLQTMVRIGFLDDRIDYTDGFIRLDDRSRGQNLLSEVEALYIIGRHQLQSGFQLNSSRAYVNSLFGESVQGYPGYHSLARSSWYFSYKYLYKSLMINVSLRKGLENKNDYPFIPSAGIQFKLLKSLTLFGNVAAVYRTPTLNDLYWQPGGNPALKPEKGYQSDMRLQYQLSIYKFYITLSAGGFKMKINNWIQWTPDNNNNYSPINIETVNSNGLECSGKIAFHSGAWKTESKGDVEVVRATNKNGFGIKSIVGKQLIYTPKTKWQFSQSVSFHNTSLIFQYDYTGYRYTTADNSSWLNPFSTLQCSLSQEIDYRFGYIYITAGVQNLLDEQYEVILLRPMPRRWYRLSLTLNFQHKKSAQLIGQ